MEKTIFEAMGGTYRPVGDYLLPEITIPDEEEIERLDCGGERVPVALLRLWECRFLNAEY